MQLLVNVTVRGVHMFKPMFLEEFCFDLMNINQNDTPKFT